MQRRHNSLGRLQGSSGPGTHHVRSAVGTRPVPHWSGLFIPRVRSLPSPQRTAQASLALKLGDPTSPPCAPLLATGRRNFAGEGAAPTHAGVRTYPGASPGGGGGPRGEGAVAAGCGAGAAGAWVPGRGVPARSGVPLPQDLLSSQSAPRRREGLIDGRAASAAVRGGGGAGGRAPAAAARARAARPCPALPCGREAHPPVPRHLVKVRPVPESGWGSSRPAWMGDRPPQGSGTRTAHGKTTRLRSPPTKATWGFPPPLPQAAHLHLQRPPGWRGA